MYRNFKYTLLAMFLLVSAASEASAQNETYRSAWMTRWGGCQCSAPALDYTDDQISQFNSEMNSHSGIKLGTTSSNASVWGSDYAEDNSSLGFGNDHLFSDDAVVYAYSGHGDAPAGGGGAQNFTSPFCLKGSAAYQGSCNFNASVHMYMGEQWPLWYANPNAGANRWFLWATCYSVHTKPNEQHGANMYYGTEYIIGFRGISTDAEATDEFLEDFVNNAYSPTHGFKGSWFDAVEDTWVDDTGSLVSGGITSAEAASRRDGYNNRSWARRVWSSAWPYMAWSWHEG